MKSLLLPIAAVVLFAAAGVIWLSRTPILKVAPEPPAEAVVVVPREKIIIANIGVYSVFNLIAKDKGYFEEAGLDAIVDEYDSGDTSVAAIQAGKADIAIAADFVGVRRMFDDRDLRILAKVTEHDVFRVIARKDKGIALPKDLGGKTVGVTRRTAGEYYLGRFLATNGLGFADVTVVDLAPDEMIARLRDGRLDAIVTFEPRANGVEKDMDGLVMVWSAQGAQAAEGMAYAMRSVIESRPEAVERYLRALLRAQGFLRERPDEAREIVARVLSLDPAYVDRIWPKFNFHIDLDQEMLLTMEDQARWVIDEGFTGKTEVPNYLNRIHFDPLRKLDPEAVRITY